MKIEYVPLERLIPYVNNPKKHPPEQVKKIASSIKEFGFKVPIVVSKDYEIIAGHGRYEAAKLLGLEQVPVIIADDLTPAQVRAFRIADNKVAESDWDTEALLAELEQLKEQGYALELTGFDDDELDELLRGLTVEEESPYAKGGNAFPDRAGALVKRYVVPPFSVLDTRKGYWQERKRAWMELIGDKGESREGALNDSPLMMSINNGVSILDPVLAEVVVRWFAPPGPSTTFDTFAGDTVFGFVSAYLGHPFEGIELRAEQVKLNQERVDAFGLPARYICDDGQNVLKHFKKESKDLFFSCPPYYDLEVYSDLPNDASNQETYEDFFEIIANAFTGAMKVLKENRFAVIVASDVRDEKGRYRRFPDDIKDLFEENGLVLYNDMVLINVVGTGLLRANRTFRTRKVVRMHQNVMVFYKGDLDAIKEVFPPLDVSEEEVEGWILEENI